MDFPDVKNKLKNLSLTQAILSIVLLVLCIVVLVWFFYDVHFVYRHGAFHPHYHNRESGLVTANDIQPWMTFDYVNFAFALPANYLRDTLNIKDLNYPRLQIGHYAKNNNLDQQKFLDELKKTVLDYGNTK